MKLYNKERKSEEIAETPDRVGRSNRIQGNVKKGKSSDSNSYEALSNQDDDDEEEETGKTPMNWGNLTPDEANASDKEERQLINKKKGITEFFTPKIQHKKKTSSDGIKENWI